MNILPATEKRESFGGAGQDTAKPAAALAAFGSRHVPAPAAWADKNDPRHADAVFSFAHSVDCLKKMPRETKP